MLYADDCLWGRWQAEVHCNCSGPVNETTLTKSMTRRILRNATGGGKECEGESKKIEMCVCKCK